MSSFNIQLTSGQVKSIDLNSGQSLYVLGANGSGKSTLLYAWGKQDPSSVLIAGNREVVFGASAISLSALDVKNELMWAGNTVQQPNARHLKSHHNNESWLKRLLFSLKAKGEFHNDQYRKADQAGNIEEKLGWHLTMPLERVNAALLAANLPLTLHWTADSELYAKKNGVATAYGIEAMSDGERAGLIMAAQVVLAEQGITILIDEPERHLHRAISVPLINHLRDIRPDLKWVISTHDLSLPRADPAAKTLIIYDFTGTAWVANEVPDATVIDPTLVEAIYGARQNILFIEGDESSLDLSLYKMFFDRVTIVPIGSCRDVENAVTGLTNVQGMHHMHVRGLVDADNRIDLVRLEERGIYSLGVYAIESVYYHPLVISAILGTAGADIDLNGVISVACGTISEDDILRLSKDAAYKAYRHAHQNAMLTIEEFSNEAAGQMIMLSVASHDITTNEQLFRTFVAERRWEDIVKAFKIKSCRAPNEIARKLGYTNSTAYEIAARKILRESVALRSQLGSVIPNPFTE